MEGARVVQHGLRVVAEGERLARFDGGLQGQGRVGADAERAGALDRAVEQEVAADGGDRAVIVDIGQRHRLVAAAHARHRAGARDRAARRDVDVGGAQDGVGAAQRDLAVAADVERAVGREQRAIVGALAHDHLAGARAAADHGIAVDQQRAVGADADEPGAGGADDEVPGVVAELALRGADGDLAAVLQHQVAGAGIAHDQGAGGRKDVGDQKLAAVERDRAPAARLVADRGVVGRDLARDAAVHAVDQERARARVADRQQAVVGPFAAIDDDAAARARRLADVGAGVGHARGDAQKLERAGARAAHDHGAAGRDLLEVQHRAGAAALLSDDEVLGARRTADRQHAARHQQQASPRCGRRSPAAGR